VGPIPVNFRFFGLIFYRINSELCSVSGGGGRREGGVGGGGAWLGHYMFTSEQVITIYRLLVDQ
jgi:hypothetical protein